MLQIAICDDNRADGQMMKTLLSESLQIMENRLLSYISERKSIGI